MHSLPPRPPREHSLIAEGAWISGPMVTPERDWVAAACLALQAFGGDVSQDDAGMLLTMWQHRAQLSADDLDTVIATFGEEK